MRRVMIFQSSWSLGWPNGQGRVCFHKDGRSTQAKYCRDEEADKNREMAFIFCNMKVIFAFDKGRSIIMS